MMLADRCILPIMKVGNEVMVRGLFGILNHLGYFLLESDFFFSISLFQSQTLPIK